MKPFWEDVKSVTPQPMTGNIDTDIDRITGLIKRRIGRISDPAVRTIVEEVLPYHLYCEATGLRDRHDVEYAAMALGEDIRTIVKGDRKGRKKPINPAR
jgi:hypothetical protein